MFTIGEFAGHGRVSIRMLRHYDAIGLLRPARVDDVTGYRYYEAAQLARLNRIIALKELGLSLRQVQSILDDRVDAAELRGMLRLRQAELRAAVAEATARLVQVEARLRTIESEGSMPHDEVVVKSLPPVRLAELTAVAASYEPRDIGPVVGPLFAEVCRRIEAAGVSPTGFGTARYDDAPDNGGIVVHAGMPVGADVDVPADVSVVDLPGVEQAATVVHRGSMDDVVPTAQALARWIEANGFRAVGYVRELTLELPDDPAGWVTELQQPITPAG